MLSFEEKTITEIAGKLDWGTFNDYLLERGQKLDFFGAPTTFYCPLSH